MRQVSQGFRNAIQKNTNVLVKAVLTLSDGTNVNLNNEDFVIGTVSFDQATSSTGSFDIGAAIVSQFKATIANYDGKFSSYDFSESTITPYVGTTVDGRYEWLPIGVFDIDRPTSTGRTIQIQAYDKLNSMKIAINTVNISYPATIGDIALKLCDACGVTLKSSNFNNNDYEIESAPRFVDSDTCLSGLAWIAQLSCSYVKCDEYGQIVFDWYDPADFKDSANLDGGTFDTTTKPYSDGDAADGGTFDDYSSGASVDAGTFASRRFWVLAHNQQSTVSTDDVTVTGISVTAQDKQGEGYSDENKGETFLAGSKGYVLSITGNKFVLFGKAQEVAELLKPDIVGLKFRPFTASILGNPVMECGDAVYVADYTNNVYKSYVTQLTYTVGSYESVSCNAETPTHRAAINASATTKALQETKRIVANERSSREAAIKRLADQISAKAGLYETTETLADGSNVFYLHDAETLGRSKTIWKMNAQAIAVSVDGGETYTTGISADGNAVLNRIYAVGINADYITAGTIKSRGDGKNTTNAYKIILSSSDLSTSAFDDIFSGVSRSGSDLYISSNSLGIGAKVDCSNGSFVDYNTSVSIEVETQIGFARLVSKNVSATIFAGSRQDMTNISYSMPIDKSVDESNGNRKITYTMSTSKLGGIYTFYGFTIDIPGLSEDSKAKIVGANISVTSYNEVSESSWNLDTGQFKSNNADLSGKITATSGKIGSFTIGNNGQISSDNVTISKETMDITLDNGTKVGGIGKNVDMNDTSNVGIVFDLENSSHYMTWSYMDKPGADYYTDKLSYFSPNYYDSSKRNQIVAGCDLNMNGFTIKNDGGFSGTINLTAITNANSDGSFTYSNGCHFKFKNGLLTNITWPSGSWNYE